MLAHPHRLGLRNRRFIWGPSRRYFHLHGLDARTATTGLRRTAKPSLADISWFCPQGVVLMDSKDFSLAASLYMRLPSRDPCLSPPTCPCPVSSLLGERSVDCAGQICSVDEQHSGSLRQRLRHNGGGIDQRRWHRDSEPTRLRAVGDHW